MLNFPLVVIEESHEARESLREILSACGFDCTPFAEMDSALAHLLNHAPEGSSSVAIFGEKAPTPNASLFLEALQKSRPDLWKKASVFVLNTIPMQVQGADGKSRISTACRLASLGNLLSMLSSLHGAKLAPAVSPQSPTLAAQS